MHPFIHRQTSMSRVEPSFTATQSNANGMLRAERNLRNIHRRPPPEATEATQRGKRASEKRMEDFSVQKFIGLPEPPPQSRAMAKTKGFCALFVMGRTRLTERGALWVGKETPSPGKKPMSITVSAMQHHLSMPSKIVPQIEVSMLALWLTTKILWHRLRYRY